MLIKNPEEVVKAKFVGDLFVMAITPTKVCLYDISKPQIILTKAVFEQEITVDEDDEINDFDFKFLEDTNKIHFLTAHDSKVIRVMELDLNTFECNEVNTLKNKHENICLKAQFSGDLIYSTGFDYKLIQRT